MLSLCDATGKVIKNQSKAKTIAAQLGAYNEDLNDIYDEQTGCLKMTKTELKALVDQEVAQEKATAVEEQYNESLEKTKELIKEQTQLEKDIGDLQAANNTIGDERNAIVDKLCEKYGITGNTLVELENKLTELNEQYENVNNEIAANSEEQVEWTEKVAAAKEEQAAREQAAEQETANTTVAAMQEKQAALDNALASQTATLDMLSEKNQETVSSLQETWQRYVEQATNMFSTLDDTVTVSVDQMIANIEKNQSVISNWGTNMQSLRDRFSQLGLDSAILDQMQDLGPEGAGYVAALVTASDEQLQRLSADFAQGGATATSAMYNSMSTAGQENLSKVQKLVTVTKDTLASEFANANFSEVSENALDGLIEGFEDDTELIDQIKTLAENAGVVIPDAWQIHSPSKVFKDDGDGV